MKRVKYIRPTSKFQLRMVTHDVIHEFLTFLGKLRLHRHAFIYNQERLIRLASMWEKHADEL